MKSIFNLIAFLFVSFGMLTSPLTAAAPASSTKHLADRGSNLAKGGQYQEALTSLNTAIQADPQSARAYKLRGHVYYAMGDYARALTDLDYVVALIPDSANALADRAIVHSVMGHHGLALADIERALALKPSSSFAQAVRKEVLERAQQVKG